MLPVVYSSVFCFSVISVQPEFCGPEATLPLGDTVDSTATVLLTSSENSTACSLRVTAPVTHAIYVQVRDALGYFDREMLDVHQELVDVCDLTVVSGICWRFSSKWFSNSQLGSTRFGPPRAPDLWSSVSWRLWAFDEGGSHGFVLTSLESKKLDPSGVPFPGAQSDDISQRYFLQVSCQRYFFSCSATKTFGSVRFETPRTSLWWPLRIFTQNLSASPQTFSTSFQPDDTWTWVFLSDISFNLFPNFASTRSVKTSKLYKRLQLVMTSLEIFKSRTAFLFFHHSWGGGYELPKAHFDDIFWYLVLMKIFPTFLTLVAPKTLHILLSGAHSTLHL